MRARLPDSEGLIDRDGVRLHYEVYGNSACTIVFVPTWAIIHSRCWKAQVPDFSERFRVITYDPRGNGKSDRPDRAEAYGFDLVVEDVAAIMDVTGTDEAILVGFSFSSAVAFAAAARFPERVKAVVSVGAWTPVVPAFAHRATSYAAELPEMRDFLDQHLGTGRPVLRPSPQTRKRALYLSSPIGLGHARRDLAVTRELRKLCPDLQVDWLAQDPVTRFLAANAERVHPASRLLANESAHIEAECGEHDLNAFQAIRSMDEILIRNFMVFQEVLEEERYDLVIADEAWDLDHYWHEHPELKKAPAAWSTDFVGWVPFEENGPREAFLTADDNAEMIEHVEAQPGVRDRAIFVGTPDDIIDRTFGVGLPSMRDWIPRHFDFADQIIGQHPSEFGSRDDLRGTFGYDDGRKVCIVAVGGSAVGATLIRRILAAYPAASLRSSREA